MLDIFRYKSYLAEKPEAPILHRERSSDEATSLLKQLGFCNARSRSLSRGRNTQCRHEESTQVRDVLGRDLPRHNVRTINEYLLVLFFLF